MNNLFKNNNLLIFYVLLSYLLRCPATEVLESSPLGENRGQTPKFPPNFGSRVICANSGARLISAGVRPLKMVSDSFRLRLVSVGARLLTKVSDSIMLCASALFRVCIESRLASSDSVEPTRFSYRQVAREDAQLFCGRRPQQ